ncbi:MAG: zf-HC2 domain-containing protein [Acidobacteriaceae bacterium]
MAEQNQFGQKPESRPGGLRCEEWELLLADALDGLLPEKEAAAFAAHSAGCPACSDLLAHSRQGREWLGYLHTEPEIPDGLVARILDRTVGASSIPVPLVAGAGQGTGAVAAAVPWRRNFHEMRLLMTVAMAFFSIALTLNLAGVRFSTMRLADLRPSTIGSALSRQFYGAQGQVVKFYNNLRFVYQLESRMRELRRDVDTTPPAQQQKTNPPARPGSSKDGRLDPIPAIGSPLNAKDGTTRQASGNLEQDAQLGPRSDHGLPQAGYRETEAQILFPRKSHRAGPRRVAELAGYDGRSLA